MLIELSLTYPSILVWKSKQCEDISCPCISYFTLWPVLSQMSMTTEFRAGRPTQTIPESARAGSSRPRWLATHPRHKPTQIAVIAGRHKLFAPDPRPPPPAPVWKSKRGKSGHEKTPHPRKGRGLDLPEVRRISRLSQGDARQNRRAWREN